MTGHWWNTYLLILIFHEFYLVIWPNLLLTEFWSHPASYLDPFGSASTSCVIWPFHEDFAGLSVTLRSRGRLVWRYPWSLNRRISNWRKRETKNFMNVLGQRRGWSLPLPLSSTTLAAKQWTRSHSNLFRCWLDFIVFYLVTSIT